MSFVSRLSRKVRTLGLQPQSWYPTFVFESPQGLPSTQDLDEDPGFEVMDGSMEGRPIKLGLARKRAGSDLCAIFVHAGAGYHSIQNEQVHLKACEDAAKCAMTFMKNGGSAVQAIETAIKVLEDNEITNAGYGSNLSMDGTVEGDATVVDWMGRAGAVGAIASMFLNTSVICQRY